MNSPAAPPLDLLSPAFIEDPSAMIDAMLAEAPIFFDPRLYGWMVGRYKDIQTLERDARLTSQREGYVAALLPDELRASIAPLVQWYAEWMTMRDGADHRRLRKLAAHAFQPKNVNRLEQRMVEIVDQIIDKALERGHMEVMSELAYPLPRMVICEMVGIPEADRARFDEWTPDLTSLLAASLTSEEAIARCKRTRESIYEYFGKRIAERRKAPVEGEILTALVQASEQDDSLTEAEIIDLISFILTGAYETTSQLISNGLLRLLSDKEQLAAVRADPATRVPAWVEESLRLDPSITINTRAVVEAFEYEGHRFEPGQMVYFLPIAANRDAELFSDPHRFDIARENAAEHITFGHGAHFCIGAPLARLEATVAFRRLLERAPNLSLPEQPIKRVPNMVVRGLTELKINLAS